MNQIRIELEQAYLKPENIKKLVEWLEWRDGKSDPYHEMTAKM